MSLWDWVMTFWPQPFFSQASAPSGGGIDPSLLYVAISALVGTIATLASLLYNGERSRRIRAEEKLEKFYEIAPDLAENVRWLVERERQEQPPPWPDWRSASPPRPRSPRPRRKP